MSATGCAQGFLSPDKKIINPMRNMYLNAQGIPNPECPDRHGRAYGCHILHCTRASRAKPSPRGNGRIIKGSSRQTLTYHIRAEA